MEEHVNIIVERMVDLGGWELYRFTDDDSDEVVCKIALRLEDAGSAVEYGVWRKEESEPSATGSLDLERVVEWGDDARERTLRGIATIYEDGMPEVMKGLSFSIGEVDEGDDEAGEEGDDSE